jgi:glycerate-2-kinase
MLEGARKKAEDLGLTPILFPRIGSTVEAGELGKALSAMALQIEGKDDSVLASRTPFKTPCVLISGGESIVTVGKGAAEAVGGRNQEFVLSSALRMRGSRNITVAAVDSDGTDGPTDVAGGVADGHTAERAEEDGVNIFQALKTHNTTAALRQLDDAILTGNTGTNLQDLRVIYIN